MERKAKIVATIGPASQDDIIIERLMQAGMNVARLNFSHGNYETHAKRILQLRAISARIACPLGILQDLQGPKIRVGVIPVPLDLIPNQKVLLYPEDIRPITNGEDLALIPVDFPGLFDSVMPGDLILLDDGRLRLSALSIKRKCVLAEVLNGGLLSSNKGINLPGKVLGIPALTAKDSEDLRFGLAHGVDMVAISFVCQAEDVLRVKQEIAHYSSCASPLVIAKLERPDALENLEAILEVSDGVMVARGDLGVEMAPEDVPVAQKRIIKAANSKGKIVITATQMLESMIHNPLPTRAEASDVANAVFDGTDAVMLSGETAVGEFPVEAVTIMDRIICHAEAEYEKWGFKQDIDPDNLDDAIAVTFAARELAHDQDVAAIAVFTRKGRSALLMSKTRPCVPIQAFTPEASTFQKLSLAWGVYPHIVPYVHSVEEMFMCIEKVLRDTGKVKSNQQVVMICGFPIGEVRPPNMVLLHTLGE